MGVYAYTYIGAYFEMPEKEVEIVKDTIKICPECKSKYSCDARFCSQCASALKEKQIKSKMKVSLWDIMEDEAFMQPEYGNIVLANYSSKYKVNDETNDMTAYEYDENIRLKSIAEFESKASEIFEWFDDNEVERPKIKYGTVTYMC